MSVDSIVGLLTAEKYNAIMVIINYLTKIGHFVPTTNKVTAEDTANLFINHVYRLHSLLDTVVSDQGPQFNALF